MERRSTPTPIQQIQTQTKFIGLCIPIDFHEKITEAAEREGMSASQLIGKPLFCIWTR